MAQEEGPEASGSPSRAGRPALSSDEEEAAAAPTAKGESKSGNRVRAADKGHVDGENAPQRTKKDNTTGDQDAAAAAATSASPAAEQASSSSAVSYPLRCPYIPRAVLGHDEFGMEILEPFVNINPAVVRAHEKREAKYFEKTARQLKLVTLDQRLPPSCMLDLKLSTVREFVTKKVLQIGKAVLGLSSYIDGKLLARYSGFVIDWDEENKFSSVLTSALLIRSKSLMDEWLGKDEYSPKAKVFVHLLDRDETAVPVSLLHHDKTFNIALIKIDMDLSSQVMRFTSEVEFGQDVFIVGRDDNLHLNVDRGRVQHRGPSTFERYHYMFTSCGNNEWGIGGPVINSDGQFLGMVNLPEMSFIPSCTLLKCLQMLKNFKCIPRLHIGMRFSAIKFLDVPHVDKIYRKCNIEEGLIVSKVGEKSAAENIGIRIGDVFYSLNGKHIHTTVELENFLLHLSEEHLDKGNGIDSNMDLTVGVFHVRKNSQCTIRLTVKVSADVEVVAAGKDAICIPDHNSDV